MNATKNCEKCGLQLPLENGSGCPNCLMQMGLDVAPDLEATDANQARQGFSPPKPHELDGLIPNIEVLDLLGQGGMGAVYKARQLHLDRVVAVKIIKPDVSDDPGFADRFRREAQTMARLSHPNIVTIYEFGESNGLFYLVMEFVAGTTLRHLIHSKELAPAEAMSVVPELCDALQYAHDQGIVHRDIKPENILVDHQGHIRIADFGLAKLLSHDIGPSHLTKTGQVMGTPSYMAPEQIERPTEVDHRADIFSLGVVFYEMLTGELPMGRFDKPSQRVKVDVRLDEVVLRALEKHPEQRYQLASQLGSEVKSMHGKPSLAAAYDLDDERRYWIDIYVNIFVGILCIASIATAMVFTESSVALYGFTLSWFCLGASTEVTKFQRNEIWWVAAGVFTGYMGLLIFGIVKTQSTDPIWTLGALFASFGLGAYLGSEDRKYREKERRKDERRSANRQGK